MFKLDPSPTFQAAVQITMPGRESQTLSVVFRHKTKSAIKAFMAGAASRPDAEVLREIIESVDGKPDGMDVYDFLEKLLENYPASSRDLMHVYLRELTESRAKN